MKTEKRPWGFCETPEEKCTMNYCDENGCQNRVKHHVNPKENTMITDWLDQHGNPEIYKKVEMTLDNWQLIKPEFELYIPPTPIGYYRLGKHTINCTKFPMFHKPNLINKYFMRVLLGWHWEDYIEKFKS